MIARRVPLLSAVMLAAALAVCGAPALAQRTDGTGRLPAPAADRGGIADGLRKDMENQGKLRDADQEVDRVSKLVEEARERAQSIRLIIARVKDMTEHRDCAVGEKLLDTIRRNRDSLGKLRTSLDGQCKGLNPATQPQLAEACESEAKSINADYQASQRQEEEVYASCPGLRGGNVDQNR